MGTFAKIIRKGQDFYIQHTPNRGEYDSIRNEEIVVRMLDNKKGYESGYLFIIQNPSSKGICVFNFLLQNNLAAGLTRTSIYRRLRELEKGSEIYVMYYNARLHTNKPIKLNLIWASCVIDQDLDNDSRMELSRNVANLIPRNKE